MTRQADALQAGLILLTGAVLLVAGRTLHGSTASVGVEDTLAVGLSVAGLGIIGVWILALLLALASELLRRRGPSPAATWAARWTPATMQRLAVALLGLNVLAVPAVAQAAPAPSGAAGIALPAPAEHGGSDVLLRSPDRTAPASAAAATPAPASAAAATPALESSGSVPPAGDAGTPGAPGSPYWTPQDLPSPGSDAAGTPRPAPTWATPAPTPLPTGDAGAPATDRGWEPAPIPTDGGPMVRAETRPQVGPAEIVVAQGDSLWSIVAAQLGPLATAADVAATWPGWYEANASTIGPDPCLLLPGQVLRAPA
ncbi:LysM peptidoglycan-binding domain-containing protein [uncultured Arthrobacter sp.]|uniref:LysM peptidoglycan-binding domain-containing protein n=1 Tax=uncultured Arthrobacter sp. TaxID=114050 RepID=UPI0026269984|nr:hypothetical protein [uncultured Arthrobacter sp.]